MKNQLKSFSVIALFGAVASMASAHGDMINLDVVGGKIVTGLESEATGLVTPGRVFGSELAWNVSRNAYTTTAPGYSWTTAFASGDLLNFSFSGPALKWNGSSFDASPNTFTLSYLTASATSGPAPKPGYEFALPVGEHGHVMRYTLDGIAQNEGIGVYALPLTMSVSSGAYTKSDPYYIVFNRGAGEADHDGAIDYLKANAVPEPSTLAAMVLGAAVLIRRTRRISA